MQTHTTSKLICRIAETFRIQGRGQVLIPEAGLQEGVVIRIGTAVEVRSLDGTTYTAHICAIEMVSYAAGSRGCNPALMLDPDREVDKGAEVWHRDGELKDYPSVAPHEALSIPGILHRFKRIFWDREFLDALQRL